MRSTSTDRATEAVNRILTEDVLTLTQARAQLGDILGHRVESISHRIDHRITPSRCQLRHRCFMLFRHGVLS